MATLRQFRVQPSLDFKTIAVLTDFSENAKTALLFAASFGRGYGASIILAHAYFPPQFITAAPSAKLAQEAAALSRKFLGDRLLAEAEKEFLWDIKYSVVLHEGTPKQLLNHLGKVDLVAIGTSGAKGVQKLALGSNAETIFHSSAVPVVTVGPQCAFPGRGEFSLGPVLFPTDFSARSMAALPYALSIAQDHDAELVLIHVSRRKDVRFSFDRAMASAVPLGRLYSLLPTDWNFTKAPECIVEFGDPHEVIVEEARKRSAGMIVMGTRGAGFFTSALTHTAGSTAYNVAAAALCPVLTVREGPAN